MRDSKNFTAVCDDTQEPTEEEKAAARLIVCGNAASVEDAIELLSMLGLHPGQREDDPSTISVNTLRRSFS